MHTFSLIEGNYSAMEAKEVLYNVFSAKIQFHDLKNFSSVERFGKADIHSLQRIRELNQSINQILQLLQKENPEDTHFKVSSNIQITVIKNSNHSHE